MMSSRGPVVTALTREQHNFLAALFCIAENYTSKDDLYVRLMEAIAEYDAWRAAQVDWLKAEVLAYAVRSFSDPQFIMKS